jgi:hypothetical protein
MQLVVEVTEAIRLLQGSESVVTLAAIARIIGRDTQALRRDQGVKAILQRVVKKSPHVQMEEIYYGKVLDAVETLHVRGESVTPSSVAQVVGASLQTLWNYPRVRGALEDIAKRQRARREEDLVTAVLQAAAILKERGIPFSKVAIARACGRTSIRHIGRIPRIHAILESLEEASARERYQLKALREGEVTRQVQLAITALKQEGKKITKAAVARQSGVRYDLIMGNRQVKIIFQELALEYEKERRRRGAQLAEEVIEAITELERQGKSPTQTAISGLVGMGREALMQYPQVKRVFVQLSERQPSPQEREEALLSEANRAIALLKQQGKRPTQQAVSALLGCSSTTLKRYPRVIEVVRQSRISKSGTMQQGCA